MDSYKRKENGLRVPVCHYWQFLNLSKIIGLKIVAIGLWLFYISVIVAPRQMDYHLSQLLFHGNSAGVLSVKFKQKTSEHIIKESISYST